MEFAVDWCLSGRKLTEKRRTLPRDLIKVDLECAQFNIIEGSS